MAPGFPLQKERKIEPEKADAWLSKAEGGGGCCHCVSAATGQHLLSVRCVPGSVRTPCRACILGGRDGH